MSKNCPIMGRLKQNQEDRQRYYLIRRIPVIGRFDGVSFSNYTKPLKNRFSVEFMEVMNDTAIALCSAIQGAQVAFIESDEISVLLHDYKNIQSEAWLDYCLNKMIGHGSSIAANTFSGNSWKIWGDKTPKLENIKWAKFDTRFNNYPEHEVNNYFVARQRDCIRNSINSLGQSLYSPKELHGKNLSQVQDMTFAKGHNWNDLPNSWKRGRCAIKTNVVVNGVQRSKWVIDDDIPEFTQDVNYIQQHLKTNY
jgi:tRNA(His) guanylyltransferase